MTDALAPVEPAPAPRRPTLGREFGTLWTAAAFSNLADGVGRTAVPLIAATLTRDPLVISALGVAELYIEWPLHDIERPSPGLESTAAAA